MNFIHEYNPAACWACHQNLACNNEILRGDRDPPRALERLRGHRHQVARVAAAVAGLIIGEGHAPNGVRRVVRAQQRHKLQQAGAVAGAGRVVIVTAHLGRRLGDAIFRIGERTRRLRDLPADDRVNGRLAARRGRTQKQVAGRVEDIDHPSVGIVQTVIAAAHRQDIPRTIASVIRAGRIEPAGAIRPPDKAKFAFSDVVT